MVNGVRVKEVEFSSQPLFSTWADRYDFISDLGRVHDLAAQQIKDGTYAKCQTRHGGAGDNAGDFVPVLVDSATPSHTKFSYTSGKCFGQIDFDTVFSPSAENFDTITVNVTTSQQGVWCSEYLFLASMGHHHVEEFDQEGTTQIIFKNLSDNDKLDIQQNGVRVFLFCDGVIDTAISMFKTVMMFAGGLGVDPKVEVFGSHVPDYMAEANIEFVKRVMGN